MESDDVLAAFDALYAAACVDRDPSAAASLFVDDEVISFSGSELAEHASTKPELHALLRSIAESPQTLEFDWSARSVHASGDTAWVNAAGSVRVRGPDGLTTLPYRVTAVLVKRRGRWLWHTHAGSSPT